MMKQVKLSVIMPVYNVEETLSLALESVLMQKTDFQYEIIIVNDASTDSTPDIIERYKEKYSFIKVIKHDENKGNALSFYDGLSAAKGKYFCVLDGDDYYTVRNKFQKQVDFLDSDKEENYTAVVHKYLTVNANGFIKKSKLYELKTSEYTYKDYLQMKFYFHTSTYMYRNIFKDNVPEIFKQEMFRGDNPRTFMHLFYTKGRIKILDFFGSVYRYSEDGIWSKMTQEEQKSRNLKMYKFFLEQLDTNEEKEALEGYIKKLEAYIFPEPNEEDWQSPDVYLNEICVKLNLYIKENNNFLSKNMYKMPLIDSYIETIGFIAAIKNKLMPSKSLKSDTNNILINISIINSIDLPYFKRIEGIIKNNYDKNVYILLTEIENVDDLKPEISAYLKQFDNLTLLFGQKAYEGKLNKLIDIIQKVKPSSIYSFCWQVNVYVNAIAQHVFGANLSFVAPSKGLKLGLENSSFDTFIADKYSDYILFCKYYQNKVVYISNGNVSEYQKEPEYKTQIIDISNVENFFK